MWRNILAGVIGYVVMFALVGLSTLLLMLPFPDLLEMVSQGGSPPTSYLVLNLASGFLSAIAGGFVCNWIARGRLKVTLQLASIVCILAVFYAWTSWGGVQPAWYLLMLIVLEPPGVALGGVLQGRWRRHQESTE